jgi:hypothetical protein
MLSKHSAKRLLNTVRRHACSAHLYVRVVPGVCSTVVEKGWLLRGAFRFCLEICLPLSSKVSRLWQQQQQ